MYTDIKFRIRYFGANTMSIFPLVKQGCHALAAQEHNFWQQALRRCRGNGDDRDRQAWKFWQWFLRYQLGGIRIRHGINKTYVFWIKVGWSFEVWGTMFAIFTTDSCRPSVLLTLMRPCFCRTAWFSLDQCRSVGPSNDWLWCFGQISSWGKSVLANRQAWLVGGPGSGPVEPAALATPGQAALHSHGCLQQTRTGIPAARHRGHAKNSSHCFVCHWVKGVSVIQLFPATGLLDYKPLIWSAGIWTFLL